MTTALIALLLLACAGFIVWEARRAPECLPGEDEEAMLERLYGADEWDGT